MNKTDKIDKTKLKDTGERMVPEYHKSHLLYGEHIVRYKAAESLVENMTVLDIACGSGYGTKMLARTASKVYGVDLNKEAVEYAKTAYKADNIEYSVGDCVDIPLKDNSVDAVVSFETIEHVKNYEKFIDEAKRVLKPDGLFIVSTPNDKQFPEGNEFHVHEFTYSELEKLAKKNFKYFDFYFQTTWLYDGLFDKDSINKDWEESVPTIQTAPVDESKSVYYLAVCSDAPITKKIKQIGALSEHWNARERQGYELSTRAHIEDQGKVIRHLDNIVNEQKHKIEVLESELDDHKTKLKILHNTLPVKISRKLLSAKKRIYKTKKS